MKNNITNKRWPLCLRVLTLTAVMLVGAGSCPTLAQTACFEIEGTTIMGLTAEGLVASTLTIPKEVTAVASDAFSSTSAKVSALVIEDGGNPTFPSELFGGRENPLSDIQVLGSSMTVANIRSLFASLGSQGALSTVYIAGYSGEWTNIAEESVLTSDVNVALPAVLVADQQFGDAKVYGRFEITKELITFCGTATFQDTDDGSNMLFYVANECNKTDGYVHIQRVRFVAKGHGVLIHNLKNTSTYADLLRVSDSDITSADNALYEANMLKGVTVATTIESTDGGNTNLVLSNGAFHPTSGGTIGANKAYLQVPTSVMAARGMLTICFDDEAAGINQPTATLPSPQLGGGLYDLQGRKLHGAAMCKGIYINNGKKILKQ